MKYVPLGRTGLSVSQVVLGCMSFGASSWREWVLDEAESQPLLKMALDAGINFFDTANVYSSGASEEVIGGFLKANAKRDDVVISTKMFYPSRETPNRMGLTRDNILSSIDGSLQRLGTDYVDLYQVHRWDDLTPIEETMAALHEVVKSGKARFVGASNMRCWQLAKAQLAAQDQGWGGFATMQNHYNLLHREDERDLIPFCKDQGMGLFPWSPLARGRIARAGNTGTQTTRSDDDATIQDHLYGAPNDPVLDDVAAVAVGHGVSPARIGLAWLMAKGVSPIIGATKTGHIEDARAATDVVLSEDDIDHLEQSYTPRPFAELPWDMDKNEDPRLKTPEHFE
ncbi:MAG: aldo/keto reductase [Rhodospirillaceae bacterium]|jgi:1-deoxyxylulose-5-phosphate synthase|nr:aldo/keto reductase [Rhodospirillaceae bacterium]MBT5241304.1 aldo/keto reductase [Rhodospirillaceae bacterium]MBT5565061.1 aldo/keto reductase [Rhodospirillaceae bacterium]MBT6088083.1 aldo/keto reductase [Rhodospirillaceae bacterium]MBT6961696.1 aldo/keto reductase [Rhodospirillaceae bacterium]